jgi:hypothetical protein
LARWQGGYARRGWGAVQTEIAAGSPIDVRNHADRLLDDSAAGPLVLDETARRDRLTVCVKSDLADPWAVQPHGGEGWPEVPFAAGALATHLFQRFEPRLHRVIAGDREDRLGVGSWSGTPRAWPPRYWLDAGPVKGVGFGPPATTPTRRFEMARRASSHGMSPTIRLASGREAPKRSNQPVAVGHDPGS